MSGRGSDFFVSHAGRDTAWAEWLAWQLQDAGHSVELAVWDWAPGEDFVARMQQALAPARRRRRRRSPEAAAVNAPSSARNLEPCL
ncbi:toll/interleukin-1 receptor domain-containing protein [Geodermatophilus sp. URMC 60]